MLKYLPLLKASLPPVICSHNSCLSSLNDLRIAERIPESLQYLASLYNLEVESYLGVCKQLSGCGRSPGRFVSGILMARSGHLQRDTPTHLLLLGILLYVTQSD